MQSKHLEKEVQPFLTYLATFAIAVLIIGMCIIYDYSLLKTTIVSMFVIITSFLWLRKKPTKSNQSSNGK